MSVRRRSIDYSGGLPSIAYTGSNSSILNIAGDHAYSSLAFGSEHPTRRIIIVLYHEAGGLAAPTVTIGGITASLAKSTNIGSRYAQIFIASVPTGTTGAVVVSGPPGTKWNSAVGVYSALHLISNTPTATDGGVANPVATSVAVSALGIAVGLAGTSSVASGVTASGLTLDFQAVFTTNNGKWGAGSYTATSATTLNASMDVTGATSDMGSTASFR